MDEFRLKHGKGFGVTYVVNSDKTKYGTLEGDYSRVWQAIKNKNYYNKVIAQDLNLNESTTLRMLSTMEHHGLIEKKSAHEIKISEAPDNIKEFIINKDLRTVFYFLIGKETKSHTLGESNKNLVKEIKALGKKLDDKKVVKELAEIRNGISGLKKEPQENPQTIIIFLFGISLMIASLLTIFGGLIMSINVTGQFVFGLGLILISILGTGLVIALKKRKELPLNSK